MTLGNKSMDKAEIKQLKFRYSKQLKLMMFITLLYLFVFFTFIFIYISNSHFISPFVILGFSVGAIPFSVIMAVGILKELKSFYMGNQRKKRQDYKDL